MPWLIKAVLKNLRINDVKYEKDDAVNSCLRFLAALFHSYSNFWPANDIQQNIILEILSDLVHANSPIVNILIMEYFDVQLLLNPNLDGDVLQN